MAFWFCLLELVIESMCRHSLVRGVHTNVYLIDHLNATKRW